jgi:hypothetical protein
MSKIDPQPIIDEYRDAYLRANGRDADSDLSYENGWFVFRFRGILQLRYRAAQIRDMTARLKSRWPEHVQEMAIANARKDER